MALHHRRQNLHTTVRIWNITHFVFCFFHYLTYIHNVAENIDSWKEMAYKPMVRWHGCVWRCHGIQIKVMCILNLAFPVHCSQSPRVGSLFFLLPTDLPCICLCNLSHSHLPPFTMTTIEACPSKMLIFTYKTTLCHNLETIIWIHTAI
jgi:hypothetical protein